MPNAVPITRRAGPATSRSLGTAERERSYGTLIGSST